MTFRYYAIQDHKQIDCSNSLTSLKERINEDAKNAFDNIYIVRGKRNPLIIKEWDSFRGKWYTSSNRYYDIMNHKITWL